MTEQPSSDRAPGTAQASAAISPANMSVPRRHFSSRAFTVDFLNTTTEDMDYFAEETKQQIDKHGLKSFDHFTTTTTTYPIDDAKPQYNSVGTFVGWDRYRLDVLGKSVKALTYKMEWNRGIGIRHSHRWMSVADFVKLIEPQPNQDSYLDTQAGHYQTQQSWWLAIGKATGKSFHLLDLPPEVRDLIYGFCFGARAEPYPLHKSRRLGIHSTAIAKRNPNSRLLRTNRQVNREASHVMYLYTTFLVEHYGVFCALSCDMTLRNNLRRLQLSLSHHGFFRLFGLDISSEEKYGTSKAASALSEMKLDTLHLAFAPPSLTTEVSWLDAACQVVIVDWIMAAAWRFMKGLPVEVSGFIKTRQKVAFEEACAVERKTYKMWEDLNIACTGSGSIHEYHEWVEWFDREEDGGVSLTGEEIPRGEENVPEDVQLVEFPPVCRCKTSCMPKTWSAED